MAVLQIGTIFLDFHDLGGTLSEGDLGGTHALGDRVTSKIMNFQSTGTSFFVKYKSTKLTIFKLLSIFIFASNF